MEQLQFDSFMEMIPMLSVEDIINLCQTSKGINQRFCNDPRVWDMLLLRDYDMKKEYKDPRDIYIKVARMWNQQNEYTITKLINEVISILEKVTRYNLEVKAKFDIRYLLTLDYPEYKSAFITWRRYPDVNRMFDVYRNMLENEISIHR